MDVAPMTITSTTQSGIVRSGYATLPGRSDKRAVAPSPVPAIAPVQGRGFLLNAGATT